MSAPELTREQLAELLVGMEVSVRMGTGPEHGWRRVYGKISGVIEYPGIKHRTMLMVEEPMANFPDEHINPPQED